MKAAAEFQHIKERERGPKSRPPEEFHEVLEDDDWNDDAPDTPMKGEQST